MPQKHMQTSIFIYMNDKAPSQRIRKGSNVKDQEGEVQLVCSKNCCCDRIEFVFMLEVPNAPEKPELPLRKFRIV